MKFLFLILTTIFFLENNFASDKLYLPFIVDLNKLEAMNAFRSASLIDWDLMIKHDAFYQFAILCYEQQSPLYDPIQYLSEFIEMYVGVGAKRVRELFLITY